MANWTTLKKAIVSVIKTNGNQEITGAVLQSTLNSIVNVVGENATFAGVATTTTSPGTPDGPVFYIATTAGSYSNFGNIEISKGESAILKWDNGTWAKNTFKPMTDFNSVYDLDGNNLTKTFERLHTKVSSKADLSNSEQSISAKKVLVTGDYAIGNQGEEATISYDGGVQDGNSFLKFTDSQNGGLIKLVFDGTEDTVATQNQFNSRINPISSRVDTIEQDMDYVNEMVPNLKLRCDNLEEDAKIVLASMGTAVDNEGNDSDVAIEYVPSVGDRYYDSATGHIKWVKSSTVTEDLGLPSEDRIYCNGMTKRLYLFKNGWKKVGEPNEDLTSLKSNVASNSENIQSIVSALSTKVDKTDITQSTGTSTTAVMSQKAVSDAIAVEETRAKEAEENLDNFKVDKVTGKSLINAEYADGVNQIENPEFAEVHTDANDNILYGVKQDGDFYFGSGVPHQIQDALNNKVTKEDGKSLIDSEYASTKSIIDNPEYIEVKTDAEGKLLAGRTSDGAAFENVGFSTPELSIDGHIVENIEDPEGRSEITTDSEGKIISYRDSNGVRHEEVGIDVRKAAVKSLIAQDITFKNDDANNAFAKSLIYRSDSIKKYDLPDNGSINILNETFYLTKHEGYTDKNGIYPIQEYENTLENAEAKRICRVYYVKSTLRDNGDGTYSKIEGSVPLTLYVPKQILVVNDIPYVKDTLTEVSDGVYEVNEDSIAVTKITALPDFQTWAINKNDEHQCKVIIDFGNYLSGEFFIGIKLQGSSTLNRPKRNLRFTFYKKSDYNKKLKVKIGEFVRLSGFNLKAFWSDSTKLKEASLNRIMMAIWEKRPDITKTYPWIKDYGSYTGATGMIKSFPSMVSIGGEYYGFYIFGLKKDEKNYMLDGDDDTSGIFASCDGMSWKTATARKFSDEMGVKGRELAYPDMGDDSLSVESAKALNVFLNSSANTLCTGSDRLSYGKSDLTFYVGKRYYTYDKVTTTDSSNGFVLIVNNDTKITAIYVTESLQTKNLLAQRTEEIAYRGTDGSLYILSELTLVDGEYFVTESLQQENHIKAVILSENIYNVDIDGEIFRFTSSELTKIGNSYYHIYYYPDEHSISATYEPFSQSEAPKHMDVLGFIDYFIGLQVFYMPDNVRHNLILYAGADKKIFYPFFYDMDLTFPNYNEITSDVLDAYNGNTDVNLLWYLLIREYADVIYNRYVELRKSILNIDYIEDVFADLRGNIPQRWVDAEYSLWGATFKYDVILSNLRQRFDWLDKYFLNLIK